MIIARQTNRAIFMIDFKVVTGWDTTRGKSLYRYFIKPVRKLHFVFFLQILPVT